MVDHCAQRLIFDSGIENTVISLGVMALRSASFI